MAGYKKQSDIKASETHKDEELDDISPVKPEETSGDEKSLEGQLEAAKTKAGENYDRFLRVTAEFENFKKRSQREMADYRKFANESVIKEILSTVDKAIEQTEALIAKQQRIKTGLMQDLLTKGIDEHGNIRSEETHAFKDSPLGRIPVEWEVVELESITKRNSPITYGVVQPGKIAKKLRVNTKIVKNELGLVYINNKEVRNKYIVWVDCYMKLQH